MSIAPLTIILTCGHCSADVAVSEATFRHVSYAFCPSCGTYGVDVAWHRRHADIGTKED